MASLSEHGLIRGKSTPLSTSAFAVGLLNRFVNGIAS